MTGSSPADLAVAFRSLGRRFKEAVESGDEGPVAAASEAARRLRSIVASAAAELGVAATGEDLAANGQAVAGAIERIPADAWDAARLDRLRELALDAGRQLREIAKLANPNR